MSTMTPAPVEAAPETRRGRSARSQLGALAEPYALVALLGVVVVFFSLWPETSETYPTVANIQAVVGNQSVLGIAALAALVPLAVGQFDLSVGAVLGLSSVFSASVMASGAPIPVAVLVGIGIGVAAGLVNGAIVTVLKVNSIIATLGTATVIAGIVTLKTEGGSIIEGIPLSLTDFGSGNTFGVPRTALVLAGVALAAYYVLEHTPFGRYLLSVGTNARAAHLVGLKVDRLLLASFVIAGGLAGAAGVLQVARGGGANPGVGESFTLPALAAAFLSAAAIKPGRYNVGGTLVAIFFLAALNSGLNLAGAEAYVSDWVNGVALIAGIALASALGRGRAAWARDEGPSEEERSQ
ncbi:MAG: ribose transport system permease protein [Thermoleophilaceae bacterium]|jgi:ribose transport system permease protein|nr:ribose transport system permease protein [Thermoleophilaceae bacterium]